MHNGALRKIVILADPQIFGLGSTGGRSARGGLFGPDSTRDMIGGNLADRLVRHHGGGVIDFIDLQWWPVFNVADAAISIGVVVAVLRAVARGSRDRHEPTDAR